MPDLSFCTMDGWVDVLFLVRVLVMTDELLLVVGNQSNTDMMPFFFTLGMIMRATSFLDSGVVVDSLLESG